MHSIPMRFLLIPFSVAFSLLLHLAPALADPAWTSRGATAQARAVHTSDGHTATVKVHCHGQPEVRLLHPVLQHLPVDRSDRRPGWDATVHVLNGWGLDLTRPDHHGHLAYWHKCPDRPACVVTRAADTRDVITSLKHNWTWFVRLRPEDRPAVDLRFSLVGSAKVIDKACP